MVRLQINLRLHVHCDASRHIHGFFQAFPEHRQLDGNMRESLIHFFVRMWSLGGVVLGVLIILRNRSKPVG